VQSKEDAMINDTNDQKRCNQEHPTRREWMMDTSDPRNARFVEPPTDLDAKLDWDTDTLVERMADFAFDTICAPHAGDPNLDKGMVARQCLLGARRVVMDFGGLLTEGEYAAYVEGSR
jgi:hypothetical protein